MDGYLGLGRQSTPGPATPTTRLYPVVGTDEEVCEVCGAIRPREEMAPAGADEEGLPIYLCAGGHPSPPT